MGLFVIVLGIILTFFSVAILSYVSIATMMGPWIAPTLVIISSMISKVLPHKISQAKYYENLLFIQAIGAVGGVVAVGYGFSVPILYFLDPVLFNEQLTSPWVFCLNTGLICLTAGSLGILLGRFFSGKLLANEALSFPTCQLTYQLAVLPSKARQIKQLLLGSSFTVTLSLLRDGIGFFKGVLPRSVSLIGQHLVFPLWPTMWVIGFTSGYVIALPLAVGLATQRLFHVFMYQEMYPQVHSMFFGLSMDGFITAFCAGLILSELVIGLCKMAKKLLFSSWDHRQPAHTLHGFIHELMTLVKESGWLFVVTLIASTALFVYIGCSWMMILFYIPLVYWATYEICLFGSGIGLVPFGRFSTLVLIPLLLCFTMTYLQITIVCIFFTVCAAVASDVIFDNKIGQLGSLNQKRLDQAQWIGLLAAACSIGIILYLLLTHFQLGSPEFFGQRGQSKALMVKSFDLNLYVVAMGFLYGLLLKRFRIMPMMTFGGLIMPTSITVGLVTGALVSRWVQAERYVALCSGVLVSEVLWIMTSILVSLLF